MTMYRNGKRGFSLIGAIVGAVVGIAIVVATAGAGTLAAGVILKGAAIGGIAGGLLGGSSSKPGATGDAAAGGEAAAGGGEDPGVDCSEVQKDYDILKQGYQEAQKGLQQAQDNLVRAGQMATSTPADYAALNKACFPNGTSTAAATPCGVKNKNNCDDLQNQCNNLQALIDSTNQATCQVQTTALKLMPGGTASTTANPSANVFTLGLTPSSVPVGGTIALVTTISVSNIAANAIKSFSISVLNSSGSVIGNLASNTSINITAKQLTLQYNFALPTTMQPGAYTVKIFNDASTTESTTAGLTITGATSTATNFQTQDNSSGGFTTMTLNPSSVFPGSPFTLNATLTSASVQTYSVTAFRNGQSLGLMASHVPVGTTVRPTTIQQTFATNSSIPPGTYSIQISDDANSSQYQNAILTILTNSSFGSSVLNGQTGGSTVSYTGTGAAAGSTNGICTFSSNLKYTDTDALTGGLISPLQNFLLSKGFYDYRITGYFGSITQAAVKRFQSANGVPSTGFVGPLTRAAIHRGSPCI